jgi:hypothetical protein
MINHFRLLSHQQIRITLYNVSFGDSGYCSTDADIHTGRPRCLTGDSGEANGVNIKMTNDDSSKVRELKVFDVPFPHARVQLGCICDNQSIYYNAQPATFQSNSPTLEMTFIATRLNITEDFTDLYFYASYEIVRVQDCKHRHKLTGTGGEESAYYNTRNPENCNGMAWLVEAKKLDHSLFIQAWGLILPQNPTPEELAKCQTKNRLVIYSGHTMGTIRIICPAIKSESRLSSLKIFSEDWMNSFTLPTK